MKQAWNAPKMERLSVAKVTKESNPYWHDTHEGKNEPNNGYWNPPASTPDHS